MRRTFFIPKSIDVNTFTNSDFVFMITMGTPVKVIHDFSDVNRVKMDTMRYKRLVLDILVEKIKMAKSFEYAMKVLREGIDIKVDRDFIWTFMDQLDDLKRQIPEKVEFIHDFNPDECDIYDDQDLSGVRRILTMNDSIALYSTLWAEKLNTKTWNVLSSFLRCYTRFDKNLSFLAFRRVSLDIIEIQRLIIDYQLVSRTVKKSDMLYPLEKKFMEQIERVFQDVRTVAPLTGMNFGSSPQADDKSNSEKKKDIAPIDLGIDLRSKINDKKEIEEQMRKYFLM